MEVSRVWELWKNLEKDDKRNARKMFFKCISNARDETGSEELFKVGKESVTAGDILNVYKFDPKKPISQRNYKRAIDLYKIRSQSTLKFLRKHLCDIIFNHADWIETDHEQVLQSLFEDRLEIPDFAPDTPLQEQYVSKLYRSALERKQNLERSLKRYIQSSPKCLQIYQTVAYDVWAECWQKYGCFRRARFIPKNVDCEYENKNVRLYWCYLRKEWDELKSVFKDMSVILTWPVEERKFITAILHHVLKGKGIHRSLRILLLNTIRGSQETFISFIYTVFDQAVIREAWPGRAYRKYKWTSFSRELEDYNYIDVLDAKSRHNYRLVAYLVEVIPRMANKFTENSSPDEIKRSYECCKTDLCIFTEYLRDKNSELWRFLLREGYFCNLILNSIEYEPEDSNIEILMKSMSKNYVDISRAIIYMAEGLCPSRARKTLMSDMDDVVTRPDGIQNELIAYLGNNKKPEEWTLADLLRIPPIMLLEDKALCHFVVWVLWREVKKGNFTGSQWTQLLMTALLLFKAK